MKLVTLDDKRSVDARLRPQVMLENIVKDLRDGKIGAERAVVVLEDEGGGLIVCASGWHGDDLAPAIALLEVGKLSLLGALD